MTDPANQESDKVPCTAEITAPEPKSWEWRRMYREVLSETDRKALDKKIGAAETAVFSRLQQMNYERTHVPEAIALYDAVHTLRLLRSWLAAAARSDEAKRTCCRLWPEALSRSPHPVRKLPTGYTRSLP